MNLKKYILSGLAVLFLVPTLSFGMDRKDGDNSAPQPAQAQQAEPPFQNPLAQSAQPAQPARQRSDSMSSDLSDTIDEFHDAMAEMRQQSDQRRAQANQANAAQAPSSCWNNFKTACATAAGCAAGAFCGYLITKMWSDLHTVGILELPATIILASSAYNFAERIGGSGPLADIAMIASAILMPYQKTHTTKRIWTRVGNASTGVSVGGGIIIL